MDITSKILANSAASFEVKDFLSENLSLENLLNSELLPVIGIYPPRQYLKKNWEGVYSVLPLKTEIMRDGVIL